MSARLSNLQKCFASKFFAVKNVVEVLNLDHVFAHLRRMKNGIFSFIFFLIFLAACTDRRPQIIAEKVAERVEKERVRKAAECRDRLLTSAAEIADSLLLERAKLELQDSLRRGRPVRPAKPAALPALDSGSVKPIF